MKFQKAVSTARTLLLIALVFCVLGLTMGGAELATFRAIVTGIAMFLVLIALYFIFRYCRCPYCGKQIFFGVSKATSCPRCRRNFLTGKKVKRNR